MNVLGDVLIGARGKRSVAEMAGELGIHPNTLTNYEKGKRLPDIDFLITFADKFGPDFITLLELRVDVSQARGADTAKAFMNAISDSLDELGDLKAGNAPRHESGLVSIPLYDVRAAAGHGAVPSDAPQSDVLHFSEAWVRQELRASPADLYLIYVDGESMEPTLRSGDVILLDRRATKPDREGIYILRMDGMLLVKRLQALPGASVKVSSDNPAYESFTVKLAEMEGQDFAILGRVVWSGRRM